jgi:large conductance mechanosensitive channel
MFREFRDFLNKGNVIDLAVAVIIGGAFGAIISSLVDDIIMPLIGILLGGLDFSLLTITVGDAVIAYGSFLQAIVNFINPCMFSNVGYSLHAEYPAAAW